MNAKPIVIVGAILLLVGVFVMKEARRGDPPATANEVGASGPAASEPGDPLPRLIDLGADKCIPCKRMAPILDELAHTYRDVFEVEFIDVWKNPAAAKPWGLRVIPTQVFIDATGTERFRHEGFLARDAILETWRELGVDIPSRPGAAGS